MSITRARRSQRVFARRLADRYADDRPRGGPSRGRGPGDARPGPGGRHTLQSAVHRPAARAAAPDFDAARRTDSERPVQDLGVGTSAWTSDVAWRASFCPGPG